MLSTEEQSDINFNQSRNKIGGINYSKKESYNTERTKDDKTSGWVDDQFMQQVKAILMILILIK